MSAILLYATVAATNGQEIVATQRFPADTWDDHPEAHAAFIDLYLKGPCERLARKAGVGVRSDTYRIWWHRVFPWADRPDLGAYIADDPDDIPF